MRAGRASQPLCAWLTHVLVDVRRVVDIEDKFNVGQLLLKERRAARRVSVARALSRGRVWRARPRLARPPHRRQLVQKVLDPLAARREHAL